MTWEEALAPLKGTMFRLSCLHAPSPQHHKWHATVVREPYMRDKNNIGLGYADNPWEAIANAIEDALNPKGYSPKVRVETPTLSLEDLGL